MGFGGWQLGNAADWGPMADAEAHALVARALELGVTLFDTAPNYGSGASERLLGEALAGRRDDVVLVSKFGHLVDQRRSFDVAEFEGSLHGSLQRLRTDHVDVLLLHNPPAPVLAGNDPIWEALERAKEAGKIRHYGASLDTAAEVEACLANTGSEVLELLFNALQQDVRRAFPLVRERGVGVIAKVPLDSGWLTGKYGARSEFTGVRARWTREQVAERARLVDGLRWLGEGRTSMAAGALAYALAYDEVGCVIPGLRTREQLEGALDALEHGLAPGDRQRVEAHWEDATAGGRRPLPW